MRVVYRQSIFDRIAEIKEDIDRNDKQHLVEHLQLTNDESEEFIRGCLFTGRDAVTRRDISVRYLGLTIKFNWEKT